MTTTTIRALVVAAIALLVALSAYGALSYMITKRAETVATEGETRSQARSRQLELAALERLLEESAADRATLNEHVVMNDGLTAFLALVEDAARSIGLSASTQSINIEKPDGAFEQLRVVLSADGSYTALKQLVMLIETLPYRVDVQEVALEREGGAAWHGIITFSVTKERLVP